MDITLVTSSFDKLVHGTENEKKTGWFTEPKTKRKQAVVSTFLSLKM